MTSNMSIYIPSVAPSTTDKDVKDVFYNLWLGQVSRVDFVEREDSYNFMAFVHFDHWYDHANAYYLQKRIVEHGQSRIVYNDPHYWIVMKNANPRSEAEVELERRIKILEHNVFDLQKQNEFMMTVIESHSRKFMDNGITTNQVKNCLDCFTEIPISDSDCPACESMPDLEPPRAVTPPQRPRTPEEEDADALALTGALSQSAYKSAPRDSVSEHSDVKDPLFDDEPYGNDTSIVEPSQPTSSGWLWW